MNRHLLSLLVLLGAFLLLGADCPTDDDDDTAGDDDDAVDDDDTGDDDDIVAPVMISGTVLVVARETGAVLTGDELEARASLVVVYLLPDPADLANVAGKAVLEDPGPWSLEVPGDMGPLYAVAIADWDGDRIIASRDVLREYAFNPVQVGQSNITDIDLVLDVHEHIGGGGDPPTIVDLPGSIDLVNVPNGAIALATFDETLHGPHGPRTHLPGAEDFVHPVWNHLGTVNVVGYLDADGNDVFEPSDHVGGATINPIVLGLPLDGMTVQIPTVNGFPTPAPTSYVSVTGTVEYDSFITGDVLVFASNGGMDGEVWFQQTLAAPGPFALRAPGGTQDVVIWAVLDADGDGTFDLNLDAQAAAPAVTTTSSPVEGINLVLGPPPGQGTVTGQVTWAGSPVAGEQLYVGASSAANGPPDYTFIEPNPVFPYDYVLAGVGPGIWYLSAYFDVGSDNNSGPGLEDPQGQYLDAVQVLDGDVIENIDIDLQ